MIEIRDLYEYFFNYFLGTHAIQCKKKDCVCRASTFMDLICEPELRNSETYKDDIEEVLKREKKEHIN